MLEPRKERFWIPRSFIDEHARKFSPYVQVVYIALCRNADFDGFSFWSCRKLGERLGINKDTVAKGIRELIVSGLVVRELSNKKKVSGLRVLDVRLAHLPLSEVVRPKEDIKKASKQVSIENDYGLKRDMRSKNNAALEAMRRSKMSPDLIARFEEKYGSSEASNGSREDTQGD